MGTVGINFGSATSGAGFDVPTTVSAILANYQTVEAPWRSQVTQLKAADTAFTSLGSDLSMLSASLLALTDFQGVLAAKQGSSSNSSVLSLSSAGPTAVAGGHTVIVSQLAQTSSQYSDTVATTHTLSGGLTIQIGTNAANTVNIVSGTSDTLTSYAAAINLADIGVNASVITDTTGSRLSLVSKSSGSAGALTVTGGLADATNSNTPVALHAGLGGQDAILTVDGVSVISGSNIVSTAIPGVTFQVLAVAPATQVQVQIANDNSSAQTAFSSLVTAYNAVIKDIKTQEGKDASGAAEPLYGNTVIAQLQSALSLALTSGSPSGSINSLSQLGLSVNTDGTLALDTSALNSELNAHFQDVVGYLQNSESFGLKFLKTLDQVGSESPTGTITLALRSNAVQETGLNANITRQDALIAAQKITLTAQLNLANQILQAIPQQLNNVNQLYNAMTGYSPSKA